MSSIKGRILHYDSYNFVIKHFNLGQERARGKQFFVAKIYEHECIVIPYHYQYKKDFTELKCANDEELKDDIKEKFNGKSQEGREPFPRDIYGKDKANNIMLS